MKVQELIDKLLKVEDKSKDAFVYERWSDAFEKVDCVEERKDGVYIE